MTKYKKHLKTIDGPIPLKAIDCVVDYRALVKYAKSRNKPIAKLTDEEKNQFITKRIR